MGSRPKPGAPTTWIRGKMGQAMWISNVDTDGDGNVSEAEWVAWDFPFFADRGVPANWRGVEAAAAAARHR